MNSHRNRQYPLARLPHPNKIFIKLAYQTLHKAYTEPGIPNHFNDNKPIKKRNRKKFEPIHAVSTVNLTSSSVYLQVAQIYVVIDRLFLTWLMIGWVLESDVMLACIAQHSSQSRRENESASEASCGEKRRKRNACHETHLF